MVEMRRLELLTPLLAKEVLSQLSYIPVTGSRAVR